MNKIFAKVFLILSTFLLIYTFYRSEIYWNGEKRDFYITYYIISLTLIVFAILLFFLNQKINEYLTISLISFFIGLYLCEGYLTFKNNFIYIEETKKNYDTRKKIEIYNDLSKVYKNVNLYSANGNDLDKVSDLVVLGNISHSKLIMCNELGYYAIHDTDRYGFFNPDAIWDKKEIDYLLIGDSFTAGACVNKPNDIASILSNLSNKSVLNLGQGGNGPLLEYATLREYSKSNVKKILWIYCDGNDLINLENELQNEILKKYLNNLNFSQKLKIKQNIINDLIKSKINNAIENYDNNNFFKLNKTRTILNKFLPQTIKPYQIQNISQPQPQFKKILDLAKNYAIKNNAKLYFIYLPTIEQYEKNYVGSYLHIKKL